MSGEGLCKYELERDRRIARNLETLRRLGLGSNATDGLQSKLSTYRPSGKAPSAPRPRERSLRHQEVANPTRVSRRIQGSKPHTEQEVKETVRQESAAKAHASLGSKHPRRSVALLLERAPPIAVPFTLRSIGTTVWQLGEIYRGPWAQQYWSSSGCLYHHAYPIGFHASKVQFGHTYDMRIEAGLQGPIFKVIDEASGRVFSGSSPTNPWTEVCISHHTGQRISGPRYFGFSDVLTQQAIAALYDPEELQAAMQGQSMENREPTAAERAAKEFASVEGIGEATAMALASTCALGGSPHASLTSLTEWASQQDNWRGLQDFLLYSEELPRATRSWPAWRLRMVPRIMRAVCGEHAELPETGAGDAGGLLAGPTRRALPAAGQEGSAAYMTDTTARRHKKSRTSTTETVKVKTAAKARKENATSAPGADKIGCIGSARGRRPKINRKYFDFFADKKLF